MKVRLYGLSEGQGSFSRVTKGIREGLEECGVLAGFFPIDAFDENQAYDGPNADVALYVGPPGDVAWMTSHGWHRHRLALFPPNSTWVPKNLLGAMEQHITGYFAPSVWAQETLQRNTELDVVLYHHGVSSVFEPNQDVHKALVAKYESGNFRCVHFASTPLQRKGTRELIEAWCKLVSEGELGLQPELDLVVDGNQTDFSDKVLYYANKRPKVMETLHWRGRMNLPEPMQATLYRSRHIVVQPSRGEGFGLCTLEARACGTPVAMSMVTGHRDQTNPPWGNLNGAVKVPMGPMAPIDDGPGAEAHELRVGDVEIALHSAYEDWEDLATEAMHNARSIHQEWSWAEVTDRFLDRWKQRGMV